MRIKRLIATSLGIMLFFLNSQSADAIRISFGLTPTSLDEFFLEQGDTEQLEFTVSNNSVLPQGDLEDASIFTFDVFTNAFFDDETLDASEWIKFDIEYITLEPDDSHKVTATLTIPDNVEDGFYVMWLEFLRVDDQEAMIRQYSSLRVPLLLYIGPDWVNGTNVLIDYDLIDIDLVVNGELLSLRENASTVWQETFSFLRQMFTRNPFSVAQDILNRPVYKIYNSGQIFLDLNDNTLLPLSDVVTHRASSVNDRQYIYIPFDALYQEVASANIEYLNEDDVSIPEEGIFAEQVLRIRLANEQVIEVNANLGILNLMMEQMRTLLANFEGTIHLNDLLHELLVPMNRHYIVPEIHIQTKIVNSGTVAVRPIGTTTVSSGLGNLLAELAFSPANIFAEDMREIWVDIPDELNFTTGNYILETTAIVHEREERVQGEVFINNNFRDDILIRVITLYGLIILITFIATFMAFRMIRKSRKIKKTKEIKSEKETKEIEKKTRIRT